MSPFFAPPVRFDPTNQAHLDYYGVTFEGFTLSLEYVGGTVDSLQVIITTPEGVELGGPRYWNTWCPSEAIDEVFQRELLPLLEQRCQERAAA